MLNNFIKNLRQSDEATKKRWLTIISSFASLIVIVLWGLHLDESIATVAGPSLTAQSAEISSIKSNPWQIFSAGLAIITGKTTTGLANSYVYFKNKSETKNQLTINKSQHNFVYQGLEPLPLRLLP